MHEVRLHNQSPYPLTTAPALLLRDGRVLAQSMMTYTAVGAQTDLPITTAVDVRVAKVDREVGRDPNAIAWRGDRYMRIDLAGRIELTNFGDREIEIEVVRHVLGEVGEVGAQGEVTAVNLLEAPVSAVGGAANGYPYWWTWYSWPWWSHHFNGIGKIEWDVSLAAGESAELDYAWHYVWR